MSKIEKVFVALDNMNQQSIEKFMAKIEDRSFKIKLGLEFFSQYGPEGIINFYKRYKKDIFFDYKLHDIPNTVSKAIRSLEGLPIKYLTLHLTGGREMLRASLKARDEFIPETKILGVSYLTSLAPEDLSELWGLSGSEQDFERLFKLGLEENIDGFILSAHELDTLQNLECKLGKQSLKITPGIRFSNQSSGDQKRVMTPKEAFAKGSSYLVMGRALTQAKDLDEKVMDLHNLL